MNRKASYLILADVMLKHDDMKTFAEWATLAGFSSWQLDGMIATIKFNGECKVLVDRTGNKPKYGLKKMDKMVQERDFITELFSGSVTKAIELSKLVVRCEE